MNEISFTPILPDTGAPGKLFDKLIAVSPAKCGIERPAFDAGNGVLRTKRVPLHLSSYKKIEIGKTEQAREGQGEEHGRKVGQAEDDAHDHRSEP